MIEIKMDISEAKKILLKQGIDPKFGYGGVSDYFVIEKASLIYRLVETPQEVDIWDILDIKYGGYNDDIDNDIMKVLNVLKDGSIFVTEISEKTNLNKSYVELIQYLICSAELAQYGTSPRGCWLTDYGNTVLNLLNAKIKTIPE